MAETYTVVAIVGRQLRVSNDGSTEPDSQQLFFIAPKAEVTLNEKKVGLADLQEGDQVQLFRGHPDKGYEKVAAVRDVTKTAVTAERRDKSQPVKVLTDEDGKVVGPSAEVAEPRSAQKAVHATTHSAVDNSVVGDGVSTLPPLAAEPESELESEAEHHEKKPTHASHKKPGKK